MASPSTINVPAWLDELYEQVDAGRLDEYIEGYAQDATLRFGSAPTVHGKDAVRAAFAVGHAAHDMSHRFVNVWEVGDTTVIEFDTDWIHPDGRIQNFPAVTIYERKDGLITNARIFLDPNG
jgi:ketosteroid isomerase-like protein